MDVSLGQVSIFGNGWWNRQSHMGGGGGSGEQVISLEVP